MAYFFNNLKKFLALYFIFHFSLSYELYYIHQQYLSNLIVSNQQNDEFNFTSFESMLNYFNYLSPMSIEVHVLNSLTLNLNQSVNLYVNFKLISDCNNSALTIFPFGNLNINTSISFYLNNFYVIVNFPSQFVFNLEGSDSFALEVFYSFFFLI